MKLTNTPLTFSLLFAVGVTLSGCNPGNGTATSTPSTEGGEAAALADVPESNQTSSPTTELGAPAESETASAGSDAPSDTEVSSASTPAASGTARMEAGVVELSPDNTTIQFVGTHVGDKPDPRTGVFTKFSGTAKLDPASNALKSVTVDIDTASLLTPIDKLTNHLKSPDFFDVREYPKAKFESTKITPKEGREGEYTVTGNLTLRKATKEISFPAKVRVTDGGLALDSTLTIDRTDFELGVGQDRVNKEVEISVWIGKRTSPPSG